MADQMESQGPPPQPPCSHTFTSLPASAEHLVCGHLSFEHYLCCLPGGLFTPPGQRSSTQSCQPTVTTKSDIFTQLVSDRDGTGALISTLYQFCVLVLSHPLHPHIPATREPVSFMRLGATADSSTSRAWAREGAQIEAPGGRHLSLGASHALLLLQLPASNGWDRRSGPKRFIALLSWKSSLSACAQQHFPGL